MRTRSEKRLGLTSLAIATACAVCATVATGTAAARPDTALGPYRISVGTSNAITDVPTTALTQWAALVKKHTKGKVIITVYPNGTLGDPATELTAVQRNSQGGYLGATSNMSNLLKELAALDLPYIFPRGESQAQSMMFGALGTKLLNDLGAVGLKGLAWVDIGPEVLISKFPLKTPDQLKGVKVRVPQSQVTIDQFAWLGADPVPLPFSETYTSLNTGVVQVTGASPAGVASSKFYEQVCCMALTYNRLSFNAITVSKELYDDLPKAYQKILARDAVTAAKAEWPRAIKANNAVIKQMQDQHGLQVNKVNLSVWAKAYDAFGAAEAQKLGPEAGALYHTILKLRK